MIFWSIFLSATTIPLNERLLLQTGLFQIMSPVMLPTIYFEGAVRVRSLKNCSSG